MPNTNKQVYLDADSHVMERPNFLRDFADESVRDRLRPFDFCGEQDKNDGDWLVAVASEGHTPLGLPRWSPWENP